MPHNFGEDTMFKALVILIVQNVQNKTRQNN